MEEPNNRPSASERAYGLIRDGVLDGTYHPGTMLGEASLAATLGMSRTPIRLALTRLQEEGWIVIYPKRGALVQGLSEREAAELADVRLMLESSSVWRAADEQRLRLAEKLDRSIEAQREAFAAGDLRHFVELTIMFHRGFIEAGSNSILLELYDRLADRHRFTLFASGEQLLARCGEVIAEHEKLTGLLRSGDAARFELALREHISDAGAATTAGLTLRDTRRTTILAD